MNQRSDKTPSRFLAAVLQSVCLLALTACTPRESSLEIREIAAPANGFSAQPHLSRGPNDEIVLSWVEQAGQQATLKFAILSDEGWGAAQTVASGDNWFVNWADFPSVQPIEDSFWVAHWLEKRDGGAYAYDVAVSVSNDAGQSWQPHFIIHDDGTATEHGFVSLFAWQSQAQAVWLDGRNTAGHGHGHDDPVSDDGGMTLRAAAVSPAGQVSESALVDGLICDCCQTDVALGQRGPMVVYRNRSDKDVRDIFIAHQVSGEWQAGRSVADDGWQISGCPVNGPAIAANDVQVSIAWFTAVNDEPAIRVALSHNHGVSFDQVIDIAEHQSVGRVDIEIANERDTIVSWIGTTADGHAALLLRRVRDDGELGAIREIAKIEPSRRSGFPQMMLDGDEVVLVWVDASDSTLSIKSVRIEERSI